jgi:hypothetical protein
MCATLLVTCQQPQKMPNINTSKNVAKMSHSAILADNAETLIVGYEPAGTPITKYDYLLSIQEALQQHARGEYSAHEDVMKEMDDYITHVGHDKQV